MAQTTDGVSFRNATVEYSLGATTWTDLSNSLCTVTPTGGDRKSGEVWTATGEGPIVTFGKLEPKEVEIKTVYTEITTELYRLGYAAKEAGTNWYLRWTVKGTATGSYRYTTGVGQVISCPEPGGDVSDGAPVTAGLKFKCGSIVGAAIT